MVYYVRAHGLSVHHLGERATPATASSNDANAVELGVKFQVTTNGWIYGVRFYKGPGNTGTDTGSLWTATGVLLAHGTFSNETSGGWQTLEFPTAVPVTTGRLTSPVTTPQPGTTR